MTLEAYVQAIEAMQSFEPELIGQFVSMGGALTDTQRAETVERMQALHVRMQANTAEAMRLYEEGIALAKRARVEYAPKLRTLEESSDRRQDERAADNLFSAS